MTERELLRIKDQIEQAKTRSSELVGKRNHLLQELGEKWECEGVEAGEKLLKDIGKTVDKLNTQIETGLDNIREKYDV